MAWNLKRLFGFMSKENTSSGQLTTNKCLEQINTIQAQYKEIMASLPGMYSKEEKQLNLLPLASLVVYNEWSSSNEKRIIVELRAAFKREGCTDPDPLKTPSDFQVLLREMQRVQKDMLNSFEQCLNDSPKDREPVTNALHCLKSKLYVDESSLKLHIPSDL